MATTYSNTATARDALALICCQCNRVDCTGRALAGTYSTGTAFAFVCPGTQRHRSGFLVRTISLDCRDSHFAGFLGYFDKVSGNRNVRGIRSAVGYFREYAVLGYEGSGSHDLKTILRGDICQFEQGVVIVAVAVNYSDNRLNSCPSI